MRAHQIMIRNVISVKPDAFIVQAANTMLQQHISGLPAVSETGKLVGIIWKEISSAARRSGPRENAAGG